MPYLVGSYDGNATFNFLNKTIAFECGICWNDRKIEKLWLYNLHYLDDLNSIDSEKRTKSHYSLVKKLDTG